MKITKQNESEYYKQLALFFNSKVGQQFVFNLCSQLIDGFELDSKGKIKKLSITHDTINVSEII